MNWVVAHPEELDRPVPALKEFVQVECQRVVGVLAGQLLDFRRWELVVIFESGVPAFERRRNAKPTGTSPDYYYAVVLQVVIAPSTAT